MKRMSLGRPRKRNGCESAMVGAIDMLLAQHAKEDILTHPTQVQELAAHQLATWQLPN
jgi:hypothetical protein